MNIIANSPEIENAPPSHCERQRIAELEAKVRMLEKKIIKLENWPDEVAKDQHGSVSGWRERALIAEDKLWKAYERCRDLDAELAHLKLERDGGIP